MNALASKDSACIMSPADFRTLVEHIAQKCRGIGCGYSRRDCRIASSKVWVDSWVSGNPTRQAARAKIRRALADNLPDYFERYSPRDIGIESERGLNAAYNRVAAAIA